MPVGEYFFDTPRKAARYDIVYTKGERERPDIVAAAWRIHAKCYTDFGYFSKEALALDGTLDPALDGTREKAEVPLVVSYLLAIPAGSNQVNDAEGTLRIIEALPEHIANLPTYKYFDKPETAHVGNRIHEIVDIHGAENVREIAAMSVLRDHSASYELMRALVHNAKIRETQTGQREVYITALTSRSLGPVIDLVGAGASSVLGGAVKIFQDDPRASRDLYVTPVLFEPCYIPAALMNEIKTTKDEERSTVLKKRLLFFLDGLDTSQIEQDVLDFVMDMSMPDDVPSNH